MRGLAGGAEGLFSYVRLEERVPAEHPLRAIRALTDATLATLDGRFEALYSRLGRPSIPPEHLLRATLLQALFSVRSERMLMEQIDYNLLFRWFVGLSMDAQVWHPTVFTKNRDRLLEADVAREFLAGLIGLPQVKRLLSDEHFTRRRHADRRLGLDEELPPEGRLGRAAGAGPQWRAQLPRREALQRDPRLDHRSGRPALPQGRWPEQPVVLHGPCPDGEPQRAGGRCQR